jgi:type I restriction enzyme S subunit
MATSQDFVTWTCGPKLDPRYLLWVLRGERDDILRRTQGSTHKTIYMPDIEQLTIPLPPLDEQRRIVEHLDRETARIDEVIEKKRRMISLLGESFLERARTRLTGGLNLVDPLNVRHSELPDGLQPIKLGWAFRCGSGTTPRSSETRYFDGAIPWLMTGDLTDDVVTEASRSLTDEAVLDYSALRLHPKGSLVIAMYGATIGRLGLLNFDTTVNQASAVLTPRGAVFAEFAFYWLLVFRQELIERGRGGGQPNISQEILRDVRVACPTLAGQVEVVDALDRERALTRRAQAELSNQIGLLQEHRQAIISTRVIDGAMAA